MLLLYPFVSISSSIETHQHKAWATLVQYISFSFGFFPWNLILQSLHFKTLPESWIPLYLVPCSCFPNSDLHSEPDLYISISYLLDFDFTQASQTLLIQNWISPQKVFSSSVPHLKKTEPSSTLLQPEIWVHPWHLFLFYPSAPHIQSITKSCNLISEIWVESFTLLHSHCHCPSPSHITLTCAIAIASSLPISTLENFPSIIYLAARKTF